MKCHHCKQPILPSEPADMIRVNRVLVDIHKQCPDPQPPHDKRHDGAYADDDND